LWSDTIDGGSRVEISENAGDVIDGSILLVVEVRIGARRREMSFWWLGDTGRSRRISWETVTGLWLREALVIDEVDGRRMSL